MDPLSNRPIPSSSNGPAKNNATSYIASKITSLFPWFNRSESSTLHSRTKDDPKSLIDIGRLAQLPPEVQEEILKRCETQDLFAFDRSLKKVLLAPPLRDRLFVAIAKETLKRNDKRSKTDKTNEELCKFVTVRILPPSTEDLGFGKKLHSIAARMMGFGVKDVTPQNRKFDDIALGKQLRELSLADIEIPEKHLVQILLASPNLTSLDLSGIILTNDILNAIPTSVTSLNLRHRFFEARCDENILMTTFERLINLNSIDLSSWAFDKQITSKILMALPATLGSLNLRNVQVIKSAVGEITESALQQIFNHFKDLTHLDLSMGLTFRSIDDESIKGLPIHQTRLILLLAMDSQMKAFDRYLKAFLSSLLGSKRIIASFPSLLMSA